MPISTEIIDVANTAKRCHDWGVRPAGTGQNQIALASTKGNARFANSFQMSARGVGRVCAVVASAELLMIGVLPCANRPVAALFEAVRANLRTAPARLPLR